MAGSCCNQEWIRPKTAHRRDTISYRSPFLLLTFNMPYALLLSLFFHIFHPPHMSTSTQCLHKERVRFHCSHLFIGHYRSYLVYMRAAGLSDRSCRERRLDTGAVPVGRDVTDLSICPPECFLHIQTLSPQLHLPLGLSRHFPPQRLLYFTPGNIQERNRFYT